jgi:DNA sulfur modification protein DndD
MLKLKKLSVTNFGPFKGEQIIDFPEKGIVILYGENMRGKTSFLNAIRYALFGKVLSRGSREQSLHSLSNWEEAQRGKYGFRIELSFQNNGDDYVLTRSYSPKPDIQLPVDDDDYDEECFLRKNGSILSPDHRNVELAKIMPEQVSRFFLFDGELLQEYEELLREESAMGEKITQSIERILGVPILTNGRADLRELHKKAQRQASVAAQRDQKTREIGNHLGDLTQQRSHHEEELARLNNVLDNLRNRKVRAEAELRKTERIKVLLDEVDELDHEIEGIDTQIVEKQSKLKELMATAWKGVLRRRISDELGKLRDQRNNLQDVVFQQTLIDIRREAIEKKRCPACFQPLDGHAEDELKNHLYNSKVDENSGNDLESVIFSIKTLEAIQFEDQQGIVEVISNNIGNLKINKSTKEDRIKDINEQAKGYDQSKVRAQYSDYDKLIKEIGLLEEGITGEQEELNQIDLNINKLEAKLDEISGKDTSNERKKSELLNSLFELFDEGIGIYRDELREKVKDDATELFLKLTSEPDYVGLEITETYGLVIIHKDGEAIPVRSAGAEHIVALSLMGALQKNAPLQGPIIMDSPFGRLDEAHTSKVVSVLPFMAKQIFLLVYRSELDIQATRQMLGGKLKSEYILTRESARHTIVEKYIED